MRAEREMGGGRGMWTYLSSINSNDEVERSVSSVHHLIVLILHKRALSGEREEKFILLEKSLPLSLARLDSRSLL